jgi:hypothetical protein
LLSLKIILWGVTTGTLRCALVQSVCARCLLLAWVETWSLDTPTQVTILNEFVDGLDTDSSIGCHLLNVALTACAVVLEVVLLRLAQVFLT